jgi:iduronate 2-sulfatase
MKLILIATLLNSGYTAIAAEKPNVLFIAIDDLRPELRCYGREHIHSPNMDRLAAGGVLFSRAYCQYPVCNASRASLLTGLRPESTGVFDNATHFRKQAPDVVTLPQHFKEHGYITQALGKLYHGAFEKAYVGRSLDDPRSWSGTNWYGSPQYYFSPQGIKVAREVYGTKFHKSGSELNDWKTEFVQGLATEAPNVEDSVLYDGAMTDRAIQVLSEFGEKPFFLAVGYLKPHLPFVAPKKYWDLYDRASLQLPTPEIPPRDAPSVALHGNSELHMQYTNMRSEPLSEEQTRELLHGYYACVSYVDAQIGRLLGELDRRGLRESTIIVLWGDHGYHLGEQSLWGKLTNFELAARVPLIVSTPNGKGIGAKSSALVELVDIYPSLCELADLPLPSHLEGTSFVPLLDFPDLPWKAAVFTEVVRGNTKGHSMRTERYRFTRWHKTNSPAETLALELYDLLTHQVEMENIAGRSENEALVEELSAKLDGGWRTALPRSAKGTHLQPQHRP